MLHNRAVSRTWGGAVAAATLVLLAACGGQDKPTFDELPFLTAPPVESPTADPSPSVSPDPSATTTATPSATSRPTPSAEPTGAIADGRHPVYLTGIDLDADTITVDVVQFFTGSAATQAATEDRAPEVPPPNDYWVRNRNSLVRTLSLAPDATITVNTLAAQETGNSRKDLAVPLRKLAAYPDVKGQLFWLTVSGGTVTVLAEQYLP